jgi:hypothetical protein
VGLLNKYNVKIAEIDIVLNIILDLFKLLEIRLIDYEFTYETEIFQLFLIRQAGGELDVMDIPTAGVFGRLRFTLSSVVSRLIIISADNLWF